MKFQGWSIAAGLTLAVLASACGTAPRTAIGMKEYSANVVYGDNASPPPPTVPPAAALMPAFPGFIVPPAPRVETPAAAGPTRTTVAGQTTTPRPVPPAVACPEDDPLATPRDEAQITVPGPPKPATIPYRQSGSYASGNKMLPFDPVANHTIDGVTNLAAGTFRFNVAIGDAVMNTVTTYQVDQRGAQDGISIAQIRAKDQLATDAFTPAAPITILPLPPVKGRTFTGSGSDPVHQIAMTIYGKTLGKAHVNACGTPIEAWLVLVGSDPQSGQPSRIVTQDGTTTITGTYAVATQFGGLVVSDDLTFSDGNGKPVKIQRDATNKVPAKP